jgi:hypothetical protein
MSVKKKRLRRGQGAAVMALVLSLFLFVLFCGLFAFDASRAEMAKRELVAACDSAAITGTAMLASYDTSPGSGTSLATAQDNAAAYARNMFQHGTLLGQSLSTATTVGTPGGLGSVTPFSCNILIAVCDPTNGFKSVAAGDPAGKAISVFACYGYEPQFLSCMPFKIGLTGLQASSTGGLPQVDAIVCFDYSGSMDDFTRVSFVRREWNWGVGAATGNMQYTVVNGLNPGPSHTLSDYLRWNYDPASGGNPSGNGVNVLEPQNLEASSVRLGSPVGQNWMFNPLLFDVITRVNPLPLFWTQNKVSGPNGTLLNQNDYGNPPGNYKPLFFDPTTSTSYTQPAFETRYGIPAGTSAKFYPNLAANPPGSQNLPSPQVVQQYTDMVVNIASPGNLSQPIPQTDHYIGFVWTPTSEPDPRLTGTYTFLNIATVVEAARGNMDNNANYKGAGLNKTVTIVDDFGGVTPNVQLPPVNINYQLAYERLAMLESQPYATACDGAQNGFFYKMNEMADCRFGFVGFSEIDSGDGQSGMSNSSPNRFACGTSGPYSYMHTSQFFNGTNVWWRKQGVANGLAVPYQNTEAVAGTGNAGHGFRMPRITIDKNNNNLNLVTSQPTGGIPADPAYANPQPAGMPGAIWSSTAGAADADGVWNGRPIVDTYTDEAMATTIAMFSGPNYNITGTSSADRPASRKAIVFFTDGEPTNAANPSASLTGTVATNTTTYAQQCQPKGIAIFTIGLNMTGLQQLTNDQYKFLGDGTPAPASSGYGGSTQGLAYYAGNGGKFFECSSGPDVRQAFTSVARRLSQNQE